MSRQLDCKGVEASFTISYKCQSGEEMINGNALTIPSPFLRMFVLIKFNGVKAPKEIADSIGVALRDAPYFQDLNYSPKLLTANDTYSLELRLNCSIFDSVYSELMSLNPSITKERAHKLADEHGASQDLFLQSMDNVVIEFDYQVPSSTMKLPNMVEALEFAFVSSIIDLEPKFPFIFSFYGRMIFKCSYPWIKKDIGEVKGTSEVPSDRTYELMVIKALTRLHNKVNTDYNTIDCMRQISKGRNSGDSSPGEKLVKKYGAMDSVDAFRNHAFRLNFFVLETIETNFKKTNTSRARRPNFIKEAPRRKHS